MANDRDREDTAAVPADWQDWQRWVQDVDWSDWRSWLQRLAAADWTATDWTAGPWSGTPWEQSPQKQPPQEQSPQKQSPQKQSPQKQASGVALTLRAFEEDEPGDRISEHLTATWPAFRQWWQSGAKTRPTATEARARLEEHMPELVPVWQQLTAMIKDEQHDAAAVLAQWNPPPFLTGCSQAVVLGSVPALIRNYDWDYRLFDGAVARTAYTGRRVLGMLECLWGLLDGVNDAGLAVSLTFGGRPEVGEGFGIPLVIRYVLEVCTTVEEAVRVLSRVPVHMSYNVTVLDHSGQSATVYVAPDRPARVTGQAAVTNHQGKVEWAPYVAAIRSVERLDYLQELLVDGADVPAAVAAFLAPPLYATRFGAGFGTLYTAEYRPAEGVVRYHWPDRTWEHSLDHVTLGTIQPQLGAS